MESKNILQEASDLVYGGQRQHDYGHPRENFARIASLWNGYFEAQGSNFRVTPAQTSDLMLLLKMARIMNSPDHRDSYIDMAGYVATRARCQGVDD